MKIHYVYPTSNYGDFRIYCTGKKADLTYPAHDRYTIYKEKATCKRCLKEKKEGVTLKQTRFK